MSHDIWIVDVYNFLFNYDWNSSNLTQQGDIKIFELNVLNS